MHDKQLILLQGSIVVRIHVVIFVRKSDDHAMLCGHTLGCYLEYTN